MDKKFLTTQEIISKVLACHHVVGGEIACQVGKAIIDGKVSGENALAHLEDFARAVLEHERRRQDAQCVDQKCRELSKLLWETRKAKDTANLLVENSGYMRALVKAQLDDLLLGKPADDIPVEDAGEAAYDGTEKLVVVDEQNREVNLEELARNSTIYQKQ